MASITLVAPVAVAAGLFWIRGHRLAAPLNLGPTLWATYTCMILIRLVAIGKPSQEYVDGPTLFWLIKSLDYVILIPTLLVTGYGLFQSHPVAVKVVPALCMFPTYMVASVAGMAIQMQRTDDPSAEPVMVIAMISATVGLATVSIALLRSCAVETVEPLVRQPVPQTAPAHGKQNCRNPVHVPRRSDKHRTRCFCDLGMRG